MILPYGPVQMGLLNRLNFKAQLKYKLESKHKYQVDFDEYMSVFVKSISYLE